MAGPREGALMCLALAILAGCVGPRPAGRGAPDGDVTPGGDAAEEQAGPGGGGAGDGP